MFLVFRFFARAASWGALTISKHCVLDTIVYLLTFTGPDVFLRACTSCNERFLRRDERRLCRARL
jgi:hypothetical protein